MNFELLKTDTLTKARAGRITTDHGIIETPIFMPVGTVASVKGVQQRELTEDINADIILGNTYHLYLRLFWSRQEGCISLCTGTEIFSPIVEDIRYIPSPVPEK